MFAKKESKNMVDIDPQIAKDELAIWEEEVEEDENFCPRRDSRTFEEQEKEVGTESNTIFLFFPHWKEIQTTRRNAH